MQSAVGVLISEYVQIYRGIWHWKNVSDRFRFDGVMVMSLWPNFFGPLCTAPKSEIEKSRARNAAEQWRRQVFVTGGEVRYGYTGGLEYEVPQKLTHLLQCIGNL